MSEQPTNPVPAPTARHTTRYDTDPDALAWARAKVQHYIDRLATFEEQATASDSSNKARGLRVARRSAEQTLIGGDGCVVGAFDERRPGMFAEAAPAALDPDEAAAALAPLAAAIREQRARHDAEVRAATLREAADIAEGLRQFERVTGPRKDAQISENVGILRVAAALRALAVADAILAGGGQ